MGLSEGFFPPFLPQCVNQPTHDELIIGTPFCGVCLPHKQIGFCQVYIC